MHQNRLDQVRFAMPGQQKETKRDSVKKQGYSMSKSWEQFPYNSWEQVGSLCEETGHRARLG